MRWGISRLSERAEPKGQVKGLARNFLLRLGRTLRHVCFVLLLFLTLEGLSRLVHWNARPMIPHIKDQTGEVRLAPNLDISVKLPSRSKARYVTDSRGARVRDVAQRTREGPEVLFIGDSQILGWGIDFDHTIPSKVAQSITGKGQNAAILAAPAADPETIALSIRDYVRSSNAKRQLTVISLNLGNDLDELYLGRSTVTYGSFRGLVQWLSINSFLFLDIMLARIYLFGEPQTIPPGTNPCLFSLDEEERSLLAAQVAHKLEERLQELQPSDVTAILILPNDYQVDPLQLQKYKIAYADQASFQVWERHLPESIARLNKIQEEIVKRLQEKGYRVIDTLPMLKAHAADSIFDAQSHHLTALGHDVVSTGVIAELGQAQ